MATQPILVHLNLNGNELQNAVMQNLAQAPSNPKAGQHYFNTADHIEYVYNGTEWVNALAQGTTYVFDDDSFTNTNNTITLDPATATTLGGVIVESTSNLSVDSYGKLSVASASTSAKGVIEIATDSEASTGTSEVLAINPKQLAAAVNGLIKLTDLSIASGSANYLSYDNTSGEFSAKVDTAVTASSTNLVTSGAVSSAIDSAISSVYKPAGSVAFASLPTLGATYEGYVYNVTDAFTTTADFVEGAGKSYPAGTNVVCINTATSGDAVYKWDVLAGFIDTSVFVTASSTTTFTNKTFDANGTGNSITNLETADFATGVIQTSVRAVSSASDSALASEKAVASALATKANNLIVETNPALTASGGEVTWTIETSNGAVTAQGLVAVYEVSSGNQVFVGTKLSTNSSGLVVTIKMNASANVSAGAYRAVIMG